MHLVYCNCNVFFLIILIEDTPLESLSERFFNQLITNKNIESQKGLTLKSWSI